MSFQKSEKKDISNYLELDSTEKNMSSYEKYMDFPINFPQ